MSGGAAQPSEQRAARVRAFELIRDVQAGAPTALDDLEALAADARRRGWSDVARAGLFGRAVHAWYSKSPGARDAVGELGERSAAENDPVMLALGLAMRADTGVSGDAPSGAGTRAEDLARAVVLLEHAGPESDAVLERTSAHTACGNTLYSRSLFELCDEQYDAALALGAAEPAHSVDFLLAPIVFNRAEVQVAWAAMLVQLDEREAAAERWRAWEQLTAAVERFEIPDTWRVELDSLGLVLAAIASIDPHLHPQLYDLALHLAATIEAGAGASAGLRYGRRQLDEHWAARLASLASMRARVEAERLSSEREVLSRHARMDDLTGIGSRRALEQYLADLERDDVESVALILLDVDAFKVVNDRYGHLAGDAVLVGIGRVLERGIRPCDLAVRLGGDEFAVVKSGADIDVACERATAFLRRIDEARFDSGDARLAVALSAGVAAGPPARIRELRAAADAALYRAKAGGGERVVRSRLARPGA